MEVSNAEFNVETRESIRNTNSKTNKPSKSVTKEHKRYKNGTGHVVEQVIRPTGVLDPEIFVRPTHRTNRRSVSAKSMSGSRRKNARW